MIISNSGNGLLTISNMETSTSYFTLSQSSTEVVSGGADTITVSFNPDLTSEIVYDTLSITSDDLYQEYSSITLSGQSIWPIINISTSSIDYGDVCG